MKKTGLKSCLKQELELGVRKGIFPGGVLLVARGSRILTVVTAGRLAVHEEARPVDESTVYDLASLTKILSTTILTMILVEQGRLDLAATLIDLWPAEVPDDKKEITLAHLLNHSSGMTAWQPYYQKWRLLESNLRRAAAAADILGEPLEDKPGCRVIYSDLNFILLGLILERITGRRQDELFNQWLAVPLALSKTGYRPLDGPISPDRDNTALTDDASERGGNIPGGVHDDNAAALAGVAGHAGLFGCVREIWRLFDILSRAYRGGPGPHLLSGQTVRTFWEAGSSSPASSRALGFDRPSPKDSSTGRYFSPQSIGHLGFTGTSLWYDPVRDLGVLLLTNRVHPTAANEAIKSFRPRIHDRVVMTLFK